MRTYISLMVIMLGTHALAMHQFGSNCTFGSNYPSSPTNFAYATQIQGPTDNSTNNYNLMNSAVVFQNTPTVLSTNYTMNVLPQYPTAFSTSNGNFLSSTTSPLDPANLAPWQGSLIGAPTLSQGFSTNSINFGLPQISTSNTGNPLLLTYKNQYSQKFLSAVSTGELVEIKHILSQDKSELEAYLEPTCEGLNALHIAVFYNQMAAADLILKHQPKMAYVAAPSWSSGYAIDTSGYLSDKWFILAIGTFNAKSLETALKEQITSTDNNKKNFDMLVEILKLRRDFPTIEDSQPIFRLLRENKNEYNRNVSRLLIDFLKQAHKDSEQFLNAAVEGDIQKIKSLFENKLDYGSLLRPSKGGFNALHLAVLHGKQNVADWLLRNHPAMALAACPLPDFLHTSFFKGKWIALAVGTFDLTLLQQALGKESQAWNETSESLLQDILTIHGFGNRGAKFVQPFIENVKKLLSPDHAAVQIFLSNIDKLQDTLMNPEMIPSLELPPYVSWEKTDFQLKSNLFQDKKDAETICERIIWIATYMNFALPEKTIWVTPSQQTKGHYRVIIDNLSVFKMFLEKNNTHYNNTLGKFIEGNFLEKDAFSKAVALLNRLFENCWLNDGCEKSPASSGGKRYLYAELCSKISSSLGAFLIRNSGDVEYTIVFDHFKRQMMLVVTHKNKSLGETPQTLKTILSVEDLKAILNLEAARACAQN